MRIRNDFFLILIRDPTFKDFSAPTPEGRGPDEAAGVLALATPGADDALGLLMVLLVSTLGWVIVRYSRQYLAGEPRQAGYIAALLLTLAAVCVVVQADHLGVLVAAWIASSLALHRLLVFYPERIAARTAAHKKFLSNRLSEACLLVALYLVWHEAGTLSIGRRWRTCRRLQDAPQWTVPVAQVVERSRRAPDRQWLGRGFDWTPEHAQRMQRMLQAGAPMPAATILEEAPTKVPLPPRVAPYIIA